MATRTKRTTEELLSEMSTFELVKEHIRLNDRLELVSSVMFERTGMETQEFIEGMRKLLAPAPPKHAPEKPWPTAEDRQD